MKKSVDDLVELGALLRQFRLAASLTQEALAERAGLSREAISLLERGARLSPRRDTLDLLAKTLGLSAADRARLDAARRRSGDSAPIARRGAASVPVRLTSFVGREREIAQVRELVLSKRLVTLKGSGGIGKTSLALEVAAGVQSQFADGVALVELAALTDGDLVPTAVAAALDVRGQRGESVLTTLIVALQTSQRLLVLDNCEHLLLGCAQLAEALLRACPHLRILATSREPLRIGAEVIWRIPALTLPDDDAQPLEVLARSEAVRLFVERAGAVRFGFVLTDGNAAAVAEVCRRLEGIPLAIELAAARVAALTPDQIAGHLHDRLRLLTMGSRTALPRHQTLRALLDWSYDLLSETEQILFRRLGVFAGGWTLEAAEAVCGDREWGTGEDAPTPASPISLGDVLDLLIGLVDKSLVLVEEHNGEARFTMLETIRAYAVERSTAKDEATELHRRHAGWFLHLAETAKPSKMSEENLQHWLARIKPERDNLRAAVRWLREAGEVEAALRLVGALWLFWVVQDDYTEGKAQLETVLALPGVTDYPAEFASARRGAGHMAFGLDDLPTARSHFEWAVAYYRRSGDRPNLGDTLMWLGAVARRQSDFASAIPWIEEALALARDLGNQEFIAFALYHLGDAWSEQGDLLRARALLEESAAVFRLNGTTEWLRAQSLAALGVVVEGLGDDDRARSHYREALTYLGHVEDRINLIGLLESFASLAAKANQPVRALHLIGCADRLGEEIHSELRPGLQRRHSRTLDLAGRCLSPEVVAAELARGREMTLREAVAYALAES